MQNIYVFVHHEGRTEYARKCLQMVERTNKKVVFLGDDSNKDFSVNHVNVNDYCGEEWERFKAVYRNMSFYTESYSIQIFKRFFAMKAYMKKNHITECVLIDSDVLSFANYSEIPIFHQCDATLFIPREEKQGSDPFSYGNLYWGASAGTSYFSYRALEEIIAFFLDIYENHVDMLEKKWEWHQKNNYGGGVCEMSLLFLWYLQTDLKVINTKQIFTSENGKYVIDNDVRTVNDKCCFKKYKKKDIEVAEYKNGKTYLQMQDGSLVFTPCLHFGGITKRYMTAFMHIDDWTYKIRLNIAYIKIRCFEITAYFYVRFLKKYIGKYRKKS